MTSKNKTFCLRTLFIIAVLAGLIGIGSFIGCSTQAVGNLVKLTANPAEVTTGRQVRLAVNILNSDENGYDISFSTSSGEIQGGDDFQIMGNRHTAVYNPEPYYGQTYRLDIVSVNVSSLTGKFIGSDTVTVKVKAGD